MNCTVYTSKDISPGVHDLLSGLRYCNSLLYGVAYKRPQPGSLVSSESAGKGRNYTYPVAPMSASPASCQQATGYIQDYSRYITRLISRWILWRNKNGADGAAASGPQLRQGSPPDKEIFSGAEGGVSSTVIVIFLLNIFVYIVCSSEETKSAPKYALWDPQKFKRKERIRGSGSASFPRLSPHPTLLLAYAMPPFSAPGPI